MAKKNFLEVFDNLQLNDELRGILELVDITRIVTKIHNITKIRIYIEKAADLLKSLLFSKLGKN